MIFSQPRWLHKKWSSPLRISSVNVTKSAVFLNGKLHFLWNGVLLNISSFFVFETLLCFLMSPCYLTYSTLQVFCYFFHFFKSFFWSSVFKFVFRHCFLQNNKIKNICRKIIKNTGKFNINRQKKWNVKCFLGHIYYHFT